MESKAKILICDDNIAVHESLSSYLKSEDMICVSAYDGKESLHKVKNESFDAIVLDIMMPSISGIDVCREIRKTSDIPIIMLSAKGEELDRIIGLEIGADDYVTKPFSPREVVVRIRTILRRSNAQMFPNVPGRIVIGKMIIDAEGYEVSIENKKLDLTPKEIELLIFFSKNPNKVLSREQILGYVWGYDYSGDTRAVDTLVKRLRPKICISQTDLDIKSVYGVGYKFEVKNEKVAFR